MGVFILAQLLSRFIIVLLGRIGWFFEAVVFSATRVHRVQGIGLGFVQPFCHPHGLRLDLDHVFVLTPIFYFLERILLQRRLVLVQRRIRGLGL